MTILELHQFGGSEGSYAGDCAVLIVKSQPPLWCVIDLGTAKNKDANRTTQADRAVTLVRENAIADGYVVLTHRHEDHIGGVNKEAHLRALGRHALHTTLDSAAALKASAQALGEEKKKNGSLLLTKTVNKHQVTVQLIYPDFEAVARKLNSLKRKEDENLCSLGAFLVVKDTIRDKVLFSFLTLGDMLPIKENEDQVLAVVGKTPVHLLKYPHHGSTNNYFARAFEQILKDGCHVIVSGYTRTDMSKLGQLFNHGASTVTLLLQNATNASNLLTLGGYQMLREATGSRISVWKDALITVSDGCAAVQGRPWTVGKKFGEGAKLGNRVDIDLLEPQQRLRLAGKAYGGHKLQDEMIESDEDDGWEGWDDVDGELKWQATNIIGVDHGDAAYQLVPTQPDGQCFYRCCARYELGDDARCNELRQRLAQSMTPGGERDRVSIPTEFATFEDIDGMASLLGITIVVHLSEMADRGQKVGRYREFNPNAPGIPLHVLFEYNPQDGQGHISTLRQIH